MRLKPASGIENEPIVFVQNLLLREVSRQMMRRATDCAWIGTTPSVVLRYQQMDQPRGYKPRENFYRQTRERLEAISNVTGVRSENYGEQTVKLGACALRFLAEIDRRYVPEDLQHLSEEAVFEFMRACAVRETEWGLAYRLRTALAKLARAGKARHLTKDVDREFYFTFGFSPCNQKPRIPNKNWWMGSPSTAMDKLAEVRWPCSASEMSVVFLFANAFGLSLRAAIAAQISSDGTEVRVEGKNGQGEFVAAVFPIESEYQNWAIKQIRFILDWHGGECGLPQNVSARSKMVFAIEKAMEDAQILPCDTDFIVPALPVATLREATERFCARLK